MSNVREIDLVTKEETLRDYSEEELAAISSFDPPPTPKQPTKADLLAELSSLAAKIEAMS